TYFVVAGDLNGDGYPDVMATTPSSSKIRVLLNDASWTTPGTGDVTLTGTSAGATTRPFGLNAPAACGLVRTPQTSTAPVDPQLNNAAVLSSSQDAASATTGPTLVSGSPRLSVTLESDPLRSSLDEPIAVTG